MRHALAVHCPGCNQPIEVLLAVNHGPRWGNTHITLNRPRNHVCQEDPMTIHADRDGSEQPIVWPPKQRRDAQARVRPGDLCDETCTTDCGHCKGRGLGTSPTETARAAHASGGGAVEPVRATEAQVEAVERAMSEPTPEHIDAVAKACDPEAFSESRMRSKRPAAAVQWAARRHMATESATALLASTDPAVLDAMQDALVRAGRLREERQSWPTPKRCLIGNWEEIGDDA